MPAEAPVAPWESSTAASDSGNQSATEVATEFDATEAQSEQTIADEKANREAFDKATGEATDNDGQPDDKLAESRSKTEVKKAKDTKPANDQPAAIEFTPKAAKYAEQLGVSSDQALDVALAAFERIGAFTDDEIEAKFQKDSQSFIEQGLKLAKTQKDTDAAYSKAYQRSAKQDTPAENEQVAEAESEQVSFPDAVKKVIDEAFSEFQDDDYVAPLGVAFTAVAEQLGKHYGAELKKATAAYTQSESRLQQQIHALNGFMVDATIEKSRASLVEQYPTLDDTAAQDRVLKMYDTLIESGEFKSVDDAYRKAVSAELGEETTQTLKRRLLSVHNTKKLGQPKIPKQASSSERDLTHEEEDRRAFNAAMKRNNRRLE